MKVTLQDPVAHDPRANQKERTRAALVAAASDLLKRGGVPTVPEAAELARVSRATAYRYFPTQESLMVEVAQLNPATEPVEAWLAGLQGGSGPQRLAGLLRRFNPIVLKEAVPMRSALRSYLDTWLENRRQGAGDEANVREGRRLRWLDEALAPVRSQMKPAQWRRVRSALALTMSIEAMVVMKDVCHATDAEALATLEWAAQALLQAGLAEAAMAPPARPAARGRKA